MELIVVDDGSQDGTVAVAEAALTSHGVGRLVRQAINGGVARTRNAGFLVSDPAADYVLFVDADDVLEPEMLAVLARYLDANPTVVAAHCGWRYIDAEGSPLSPASARLLPRFGPSRWGARGLGSEEVETTFAAILCGAGITPSLTLIRRSAYVATPGWDEGFGRPAEDTLLFLELALLGPLHFVDASLVQYRVHATQNTADEQRLRPQWEKLRARWRAPTELSPDLAAVVREAWRFRDRRLIPYLAPRNAARELRHGHP